MGTAVVKAAPPKSVAELLRDENFSKSMAAVMPSHCKPERMLKVALNCTTKVPKLRDCTVESFAAALLTCSELGLEPGRLIYLIPFKDNRKGVTECQVIVGYQGLVELVMRSGKVSSVGAEIVCENDEFDTNLSQVVRHKIDYKSSERGKPYAAYAWAQMKGETAKRFEIMGMADIESIRRRSRSAFDREGRPIGPWATDWAEMAKKTVFRRLAKWLPLSSEYHELIGRDDDQFDFNQPAQRQTLQGVIDAPADMPVITGPFEDEPEEPADAGTPQVSDNQEPASAPTQADNRDAAHLRKQIKAHPAFRRLHKDHLMEQFGKTDLVQLSVEDLDILFLQMQAMDGK